MIPNHAVTTSASAWQRKHYGTASQYSATLNLCAFQAVMYALRQWWNPTKMAFVEKRF
jgi:hypothetical protein